jgi:hypothetical protein
MRRGFSASLLKRPNVDATRLRSTVRHRNSPDNYHLPLRGKSIKPRPNHSEGIELRGHQHRWISVKLPISGK